MIIWVCIRISHAVGKVTKIVIFKKAADDYEINFMKQIIKMSAQWG